jgi:hypothetical protein
MMHQQIKLIKNSIENKEFDHALKQADDIKKFIDEIDELKDFEFKYTIINCQRAYVIFSRAIMNLMIGNKALATQDLGIA